MIDLGCGNGHSLRELRRRRPDLTCVGLDTNLIVVALGRLQSRMTGDGVRLVRGDLLKYEVAGFDVVVAYLYPPLMQALEPKFERELKTGAEVWSVQFPLPHRPPSSETPLPGKPYAARLYRYQY